MTLIERTVNISSLSARSRFLLVQLPHVFYVN